MNKDLAIRNMNLHYSSLINRDCRSVGCNEISKSIFDSLDSNKDRELSQAECLDAKNKLGEILSSIYDKYSEIVEKYFGESYSKQLAKYEDTNKNPSDNSSPSEKVLKQNLIDAKEKIKKFSAENPENIRLKDIANSIEDIKIDIVGTTGYIAITFTHEKNIKFSIEFENLNPTECLKSLIHEVGHYVNGDILSSVAEEIDVETFAVDTAEQIDNTKLFEDKEAYIREFGTRYNDSIDKTENYGLVASPGYNGLPLNAGFVINEKIISSTTKDNETFIEVEGGKKYHIIWSNELDEKGNPYPEKVTSSEPWKDSPFKGIDTFNAIYKNYDKKEKCWNDIDWADRDKYKK